MAKRSDRNAKRPTNNRRRERERARIARQGGPKNNRERRLMSAKGAK